MTIPIAARKADHLTLCATGDVGFRAKGTLLADVRLVHEALPDLALGDIDLSCELLGKRLRAPIIVAAMTGGTEEALRVNRELAALAEARGYGFGLGSQRAMHVREGTAHTYHVRDVAPTTLVLGNLGVVQAREMRTEEIEALVSAVSADALCVHLNPAMELVQPGGDRDFRGGTETLSRLARELSVPVVAKETGCGIAPGTARRIAEAGVRFVDVSGAGGTSWVGVETKRAEEAGDARARALGEAFWDWGVPTAASIALVSALGLVTIGTGGIQSGLDVARALALGATACGFARPALKALHEGGRAGADAFFDRVEAELRAAMLLTGSRRVADLRRVPRVVVGELALWLDQLAAS
jgi:isopentenyl-diphosphate delta-isomerase